MSTSWKMETTTGRIEKIKGDIAMHTGGYEYPRYITARHVTGGEDEARQKLLHNARIASYWDGVCNGKNEMDPKHRYLYLVSNTIKKPDEEAYISAAYDPEYEKIEHYKGFKSFCPRPLKQVNGVWTPDHCDIILVSPMMALSYEDIKSGLSLQWDIDLDLYNRYTVGDMYIKRPPRHASAEERKAAEEVDMLDVYLRAVSTLNLVFAELPPEDMWEAYAALEQCMQRYSRTCRIGWIAAAELLKIRNVLDEIDL